MLFRMTRSGLLFLLVALSISACANRTSSPGKVADSVIFNNLSQDGIVVFFIEMLPSSSGWFGIKGVAAQGMTISFEDENGTKILELKEGGSVWSNLVSGSMGNGPFPQIGRVPAGKILLSQMRSTARRGNKGLWHYPEDDDITISAEVKPGTINYLGHFVIDLYANLDAKILDKKSGKIYKVNRKGIGIVAVQRNDAAARAFVAQNFPNVSGNFGYVGPEPCMRVRAQRQ